MYRSGSSIMRCTSKGRLVVFLRDETTPGPIVMFGT